MFIGVSISERTLSYSSPYNSFYKSVVNIHLHELNIILVLRMTVIKNKI